MVELEWSSRRVVTYGTTDYAVAETTYAGVEFEVSAVAVAPSTVDRFSLQKSPEMVANLLALLASTEARRIVEIGVWRGGMAALLALLPTTETLLAIEFDDLEGSALHRLVEQRDLHERVHLAGGVDQADRSAVLHAVAEARLESIDLVVDDASHRYAETVASFNTLFPLVRPGGLYVIEDWRWAHVRGVGLGAEFATRGATPLTTMAFELVMACGTDPTTIESVTVEESSIIVTRGPADLSSTFALAGLYDDISADLLGDWSATD